MSLKSVISLLFFCSQWQLPAFALDVAALNRMTAAERLAWVAHYVDDELNQKDSATAFLETNQLLVLAKEWGAPEVEVEVYVGQGNYRLQVLGDPETARSIYARSVDFANRHDLDVSVAGLLVQIANTFRQANQPIIAYEYYFKAHDAFVQLGFEHIARIDRYEFEIGQFLYDLGDYKSALEHLSIADRNPSSSQQVSYRVLRLMSRCYQQLYQGEKALDCFHKCLQLGQRENNSGWMGEASIDIGDYLLQNGCSSDARIYLTTGFNFAVQGDHPTLAAHALILLSKVNVQEGNLHTAAQKLRESADYLRQAGVENRFPDFYRGWMTIYAQSKNYQEAFRYQQLYDHMQDSVQSAAFQLASLNIQRRLEARIHLAQMVQAENRQHTDRNIGLIAVGLIAFSGFFIYWIVRRYQSRQKDLLSAKQRAERALAEALQWKSDQLPVGHESAQPAAAPQVRGTAIPYFTESQEQVKDALDQILHLRLLTDEDSRLFRQIFEKIHPGFFAHIRLELPELTQSETRLLALTKLNLNTKEMSEILNIEPNSIRRLRNRIRQKLNLPTGDNFEKILTAH